MTQTELLKEVTKTIVERFHPKRILLFGSHARGEAGPDSDLDLFIEMESNLRPPRRAAAVSAVFGLRRWPLDLIVYTPEEVRRLRGKSDTLLSMIEKEGKVLYEQQDMLAGERTVP
jgi:predicted nucleotidyltransferase